MIHKNSRRKTRLYRGTLLRRCAFTIVVVSLLAITFGVSARIWRNSDARRVEVEILTIQPNGFEPSQITRSSGAFLLAIDNRADVEDLRLRLNRVQNHLPEPALLDVTVPRERLNLDEYINLPPGNYALTEANHPDWVCHITIDAR